MEKEAKDGCDMGSFTERIGRALKRDTVADKVLGGRGTSFTAGTEEEYFRLARISYSQ